MSDYQLTIETEKSLVGVMNQVFDLVRRGIKAGPVVISLGRKKRSLDQNKKLWPMLKDVSEQVEWYGEKLTKENWKDVFTAALLKQKAVPGVDGGFVMLGVSTSRMDKKTFSDLIEILYAFGAEHEVEWSEPALQAYEQYR